MKAKLACVVVLLTVFNPVQAVTVDWLSDQPNNPDVYVTWGPGDFNKGPLIYESGSWRMTFSLENYFSNGMYRLEYHAIFSGGPSGDLDEYAFADFGGIGSNRDVFFTPLGTGGGGTKGDGPVWFQEPGFESAYSSNRVWSDGTGFLHVHARVNVSDGGSSALMLGLSLVGIAGVNRKLRRVRPFREKDD